MLENSNQKIAFITGISSGIGYEMTKKLLSENYLIYGCCRNLPNEFVNDAQIIFEKIDLSKTHKIKPALTKLFKNISPKFDLVFLNAGLFGDAPNLASQTSLENFEYVLNVNLIANKIILDFLINSKIEIKICLISSSIAGIRARAGTLAYSVSKSALNCLIKIYSLENPQIFFLLLGLCNVDTKLARTIVAEENLHLFPELQALKKRSKIGGYVVSPKNRAQNLYDLISVDDLKSKINSGEFVEIRNLV